MILDDWTKALTNELGLDLDMDADRLIDTLLDLARDAAHQVERTAAPITTFLVGFAAAQRGGSPEAIAEACATARHLATAWSNNPD
jgi:hypothetical protein